MLFSEADKTRFKDKNKFLSSRDIDCKFKTGKNHKLQFRYGKKAEAEAFFEDSFIYDLNCLTDEMAQFFGYDTAQEYLNERYNKGCTLKKVYILKDVIFYD